MEEEDIVLGITLRNHDLYIPPSESITYYGYICGAGKKLCNSGEITGYGTTCVAQDKVGVLLEFSDKDAKLSFYKNKVKRV